MWPAELHLLRPLWLLALVPGAILLLLLWRRLADCLVWRRLVDAHLLPHLLVADDRSPRRWPLGLLGVGWLLAALALAGPTWERVALPEFGTSPSRVLLLDLSPSMNAADLRPSRLARARFEILDLLKGAEDEQTALLAFGPEAFVVSPLTRDARTIAVQVPQLTSDLIPVPGSRETARALEAAGELLERGRARRGDIILVSDAVGGMPEALSVARALHDAGHRISVLAVGTLDGAPVPATAGGFALESDGGIRVARLGKADLQALAAAGSGRYVEAQAGDADTRAILSRGTLSSDRIADPSGVPDQWREEGPWLLLVLLPLAMLAFRRGWLVPVLACVIILPPSQGWAFGWTDLWLRADQQAARRLDAGASAEAADRFVDPAWRAAASYRAGDLERALSALSDLRGPEIDYNRGNALARLGQLDEAIAAYERALSQDAAHQDARHNLELVKALRDQASTSQPEGEAGTEGTGDGQDRRDADDTQSGPSDPDRSSDGEPPAAANGPSGSPGPDAEQSDPSGGAANGERATEDESTSSPSAGQPGGADGVGPLADSGGLDRGDVAGEQDVSLPEGPIGESTLPAGPASDAAGERGRSGHLATAGAPSPEQLEREQAMEAQLRRVPDDPAGLLRQRFLLQHLRREGRLP